MMTVERFSTGRAGPTAVLTRLDTQQYPMALCLDGTPGAFYIYGNASLSSKWHIHSVGGAWCSMRVSDTQQMMVNSCYNRSYSWLGSTNIYWPAGQDLSSDEWVSGEPEYLSSDPAINPQMHDWNKVILVYCDGSSFSSRRAEPVEVNGRKLYMRGSYILEAVMDTLKTKYGLDRASEVVISGFSAGGLSTYMHIDKWRQSLPSSTFVVGLADAGFFPKWEGTRPKKSDQEKLPPSAWEGFQNWYQTQLGPGSSKHTYAYELSVLYYDQNSSAGTHQRCVTAYNSVKGDPSRCMFAEYILPFIETPIFSLQSLVDSYQVLEVFGDPKEIEGVNFFRKDLTSRILGTLPKHLNHGGFFHTCMKHGGYWNEISVDGFHQSAAFSKWYQAQLTAWKSGGAFSGRKVWWRSKAYPCDDCCLDNEALSFGQLIYDEGNAEESALTFS